MSDDVVGAEPVAKGEGWLLFASIMLAIVGVMLITQGILLIVEDQLLVPGPDEEVVIVANVKAFGAVILVVGVLSVLAAWGVFIGWTWARFFGIAAGVFGVLSQIPVFFGPNPLWSLIVVAICVGVIYGLAVYGGQKFPTT